MRGLGEVGRDDLAEVGGKAANLGELVRAGFPVPPGSVLTTAAYRRFVDAAGIGAEVLAAAALDPGAAATRAAALFAGAALPDDLARTVVAAWRDLGGGPVAVRSSATSEDRADASSAGQQETVLDVGDADALLAAVRTCWASLWSERALAYRARAGVAPSAVSIAVVLQVLVDADAAGVLFTANPATGRRDEIVVSAAWGLGEAVVGGAVSTDDVVVGHDGRVRSRRTADKAVRTVATGRGTREEPVAAADRRRPVLDDDAAVELAALGLRIAEHLGGPQDVEWARSGGAFAILQARPITALPEPEDPPPTDWSVPEPRDYYVRASIVEQLPDPLSPLFAALIDPAVTRSLSALLDEVLGAGVVRDGELGLPTVNGYAYYHYGRALMARLVLRLPAALALLRGERLGAAHWRDRAHPAYAALVAQRSAAPWRDLPDDALLAAVAELLEAGASYYTAVQAVIPLAAASEVLFTRFHDRLVRRAGDPPAATFLLGFDSAPIRAERSLHDLAVWARSRPRTAAALLAGEEPDDPEWHERFAAHLRRHGHLVYDLDLRTPTPADDPGPLLAALRFPLRGEGADPHERQRRSAERRDALAAATAARLDPVRRAVFTRLLGWAQRNAPLREDALADIGLAWPLMRRMLAELGARRVADGSLAAAEDVHWLEPDEAVGRVPVPPGAVAARRARWRGQRRATPPQLLPRGTVLDRLESLMPAVSGEQTGPVLRGTPGSAGRVTGVARVLGGPGDSGRLQPGEILVASITTPAWTPLFAIAGGVVTDVGGPLSHSSIVAREYGIPAVLGTGSATRRIADGSRTTVDGDAGTVTLLDAPPAPPAPPTRRRPLLPATAGLLGTALAVRAVRRRRRA